MAAAGLVALALLLQTDSTVPFASPETRALVVRAQARHVAMEREVAAYTARYRFRGSVGGGGRAWQQMLNVWTTELDGTVRWQAPNDVQVRVDGRRTTNRFGVDPGLSVSRPWFVPRALGDSVRVFFVDYPARAAVHPLAAGAEAWYRYALVDSLVVTVPGSAARRLLLVEVTPRRSAPSLVAGRLWLDAGSADVARFAFRFVGTALREGMSGRDDREATEVGRFARFFQSLDVDLEYQLQEGRLWMPYRQVLVGLLRFTQLGDGYGNFTATTTFSDYEITDGTAPPPRAAVAAAPADAPPPPAAEG
ncbi:MAG: hypothetical protein NW201_07405, partial [Gemmatimonadales bacterium]|nr:hypothetical protein [Gemmatimonadales bacterium]